MCTPLSYFHDNIWTNFSLPANTTSGYASDLAVDSIDNIWAGAYDTNEDKWLGFNHLENSIWTSYTTQNGWINNEIDNIAIGGNVIWFNQGGQAVGRLVQLYGLNERVYLPMIYK